MGLSGHYNNIVQFFQCVDRLYTSESDVYTEGQILTYKDGPRAVRINLARYI